MPFKQTSKLMCVKRATMHNKTWHSNKHQTRGVLHATTRPCYETTTVFLNLASLPDWKLFKNAVKYGTNYIYSNVNINNINFQAKMGASTDGAEVLVYRQIDKH